MTSNIICGYRLLWLQVLFDLPVKTKAQRHAATGFRAHLLDLGFQMAQYSVYQRICSGKDQVETLIKKIESAVPDHGLIHILCFTDKQYENMVTFRGKIGSRKQKNPDQYELF